MPRILASMSRDGKTGDNITNAYIRRIQLCPEQLNRLAQALANTICTLHINFNTILANVKP